MMERTISIIVAVSDNWAIGRGGDMPWHISEDLKYFKRVTTGHTVIMGRKTWESIGSKPLPGRENIVISRTLDTNENVRVVPSPLDAVKIAQSQELFIIGGGTIYNVSFQYANKLYLTKVHTIIDDADTFFPEVDLNQWREVYHSEMFHDEKCNVDFEFVQYERKK